jgi:hypothetical protein
VIEASKVNALEDVPIQGYARNDYGVTVTDGGWSIEYSNVVDDVQSQSKVVSSSSGSASSIDSRYHSESTDPPFRGVEHKGSNTFSASETKMPGSLKRTASTVERATRVDASDLGEGQVEVHGGRSTVHTKQYDHSESSSSGPISGGGEITTKTVDAEATTTTKNGSSSTEGYKRTTDHRKWWFYSYSNPLYPIQGGGDTTVTNYEPTPTGIPGALSSSGCLDKELKELIKWDESMDLVDMETTFVGVYYGTLLSNGVSGVWDFNFADTNPRDPLGTDLYGRLATYIIIPLVGEEKLADADSLWDLVAITVDLVTTVTALIDPTPVSDLLNAGANLWLGE